VARRLFAALLLACASAASAAEIPLGSLFHTPEERARLDRMRRGEAEPERAPEPGKSSVVTGFVKRSDGRHTVWIDGSPITVRGTPAGPLLDPRSVRAYSDRQDDSLKIERKPPR
jgi:hypothetical protein